MNYSGRSQLRRFGIILVKSRSQQTLLVILWQNYFSIEWSKALNPTALWSQKACPKIPLKLPSTQLLPL